MKKTLITAVTLAACAATQLFAQNAKQDVIAFSLTRYAQSSVSTSATVANAGSWSQGPAFYKTATSKLASTDVLKAIAMVLYRSPGYYNSSAQLVLVQGEMGGFFGYPYADYDLQDELSTTGGDNVRLAMGRHMTNNPITGALPPGHNQPWGQIFVKESAANGTVTLCDNVSFFFAIQVQECYDCFYLNSFISDTTFKFTHTGTPCCAGANITGSGTDKYYMTLQFDNTYNNPYLNDSGYVGWYSGPAGSTNFVDIKWSDDFWGIVGGDYGLYGPIYLVNHQEDYVYGLIEHDDGIQPDSLVYDDSITSTVLEPVDHHIYDNYTLRFALNGIVSYNWSLKFINKGDLYPDFIGTATFPVTGYGYCAKVCSLFAGTITFTETIVANTKCCLDEPWYTYGVEIIDDYPYETNSFWFGVGENTKNLWPQEYSSPYFWWTGDVEDYYNTQWLTNYATYDEYKYYYWHVGDDVPVNSALDLSLHINFNYGYDPLKQATGKDYPQPGFKGYNDDYPIWYGSYPDWPALNISPIDVQPPQGDDRPGDWDFDWN